MEKFQQHLRKRIEAKIDKPFARFPLINGKHELAHEALNHTREALGLRADIEVRPVGRKGQTLGKISRTSPFPILKILVS